MHGWHANTQRTCAQSGGLHRHPVGADALGSPREQADFVRRRVTRVVVGADPYRVTASRIVSAQPSRLCVILSESEMK